jgi:hypothetical protein
MTLLQVFFIISGLVITIIAVNVARRERFNALHFLVFLGVGGGLLLLWFFPKLVDTIGSIFGTTRGADVLVYASIVFLFYFVLLLLQKVESQRQEITRLVREIAFEKNYHAKK